MLLGCKSHHLCWPYWLGLMELGAHQLLEVTLLATPGLDATYIRGFFLVSFAMKEHFLTLGMNRKGTQRHSEWNSCPVEVRARKLCKRVVKTFLFELDWHSTARGQGYL